MQAKRILAFLTELTANNNRSWFLEHKKEYSECRVDFEAGIAEAIARISEFDPEIAHLQVKDCVYRFNRDTRFSPDKSPYKNHLGAYICARGKKALRGGYYLHLEPGNCLVAVGGYWLKNGVAEWRIRRLSNFLVVLAKENGRILLRDLVWSY